MRATPLMAAAGFLIASVTGSFADPANPYPQNPDSRMGLYTGERVLEDGSIQPYTAQVIPRGGDDYELRLRPSRETVHSADAILRGSLGAETVRFPGTIGRGANTVLQVTGLGLLIDASLYEAQLEDSSLKGWFAGRERGRFHMEQTPFPESPTLGQKPPKGAKVLFDGRNLKAWQREGGGDPRWILVDGAMQVGEKAGGLLTRESFGDFRLHLEFRTPYMPEAQGQARGNSGVYLHGRYEVQVLDSFGLEGEWNECGGIYKVARPRINMCAPPTQWQTYDITFQAPRFNSDGGKVENARITVEHNGVRIHDDLELPGYTGGAIETNEVARGPIKLQDHGNPVQYRNIWIIEE